MVMMLIAMKYTVLSENTVLFVRVRGSHVTLLGTSTSFFFCFFFLFLFSLLFFKIFFVVFDWVPSYIKKMPSEWGRSMHLKDTVNCAPSIFFKIIMKQEPVITVLLRFLSITSQ